MSVSNLPTVVPVPTVIVLYTLLEFLRITVCPFVILIPSPKSFSRVFAETSVLVIKIDLWLSSPEICLFE